MSTGRSARVKPSRRIAAILALATLIIAIGYVALSVLQRWEVLVSGVLTLSVLVVAAWYVMTRRGAIRAIAAVVGAAALAGFVVVMVHSDTVRVLIVGLLLAGISVAAARYALHSDGPLPVTAAPPASRPVLLINPKSGGGKAIRFGLAERCRALGVEPIVLAPEDDLRELAEDAIAGGADLIGMAGGDGSQALVASLASRAGIPFVVVPAGTRNHFALDLGIDRQDVPAALDAFRDGADVVVDLAEVNGRTFVNNAAMGVYAKVVQSSDYRDAKLQTAAAMLPDLIGPGAAPPTLEVTLPGGEHVAPGQLLLVSNNPYRIGQLGGGATRQRLDGGILGVVALTVASAAEAERLTALELSGRLSRFEGWREWSARQLEVRSSEPVEVGVDGEALVLEPPLRFVSRPGALTVRLPLRAAALRGSTSRRPAGNAATVAGLWQIAFGARAAGRENGK